MVLFMLLFSNGEFRFDHFPVFLPKAINRFPVYPVPGYALTEHIQRHDFHQFEYGPLIRNAQGPHDPPELLIGRMRWITVSGKTQAPISCQSSSNLTRVVHSVPLPVTCFHFS